MMAKKAKMDNVGTMHGINIFKNGFPGTTEDTPTEDTSVLSKKKANTAVKAESTETEPTKTVPKTKVTVRLPEQLARLLDEVYGKAHLKDKAVTKDSLVATALQPYLEQQRKQLLEEEIRDLESKKKPTRQ